jgi:hypothetical protein
MSDSTVGLQAGQGVLCARLALVAGRRNVSGLFESLQNRQKPAKMASFGLRSMRNNREAETKQSQG